jgi:UDP-glucuronate decarboxylase
MAFDWTGKSVLVTGGAGFIGSPLCERLLAENAQVLCVDDYFTGRRTNIAHLLEDKRFEVLRHDICFPLYVEVGAIFNFACPASPIHYQFDSVQTTKVSVLVAINMLGLAKCLRSRVLQTSTSEVYGDPSVHPQPEEYWGNVNPVGPRAWYDEGRRCAETLFFDYRRQHKLPIKVIRIFDTYGPRMQPNDRRVVSNFVVQALKGEPITIYGEGLQTRPFCYVDDLIDDAMRLMATPHDVTRPINIDNPREITIRELAETVIRLSGSSSKLIHLPLPKNTLPELAGFYFGVMAVDHGSNDRDLSPAPAGRYSREVCNLGHQRTISIGPVQALKARDVPCEDKMRGTRGASPSVRRIGVPSIECFDALAFCRQRTLSRRAGPASSSLYVPRAGAPRRNAIAYNSAPYSPLVSRCAG